MVEWNNGATTAKYAYIHNLQGDIVAIFDSNGTAVVNYKYDAWGKPLATTGTLASTLGKLNPFRYRGYVYDEETGLYYLRSRYYCPHQARFINADSFGGQAGNLLSHNLFSYCANSPGAFSDSDGLVRLYGLEVVCYAVFHEYVKAMILEQNPGTEAEVKPENSLRRIDILNNGKYVYEIKPDNAIAIKRGRKQVSDYVILSNGKYEAGTESLILISEEKFYLGPLTITLTVRQEDSLILYKVTTDLRDPILLPTPISKESLQKNKNKKPVLDNSNLTLIDVLYALAGSMALGYALNAGTARRGVGILKEEICLQN